MQFSIYILLTFVYKIPNHWFQLYNNLAFIAILHSLFEVVFSILILITPANIAPDWLIQIPSCQVIQKNKGHCIETQCSVGWINYILK